MARTRTALAGRQHQPGAQREEAGFPLLDRMPAWLAPVVSVHELTHAIEDQWYDLDGRTRRDADDDGKVHREREGLCE